MSNIDDYFTHLKLYLTKWRSIMQIGQKWPFCTILALTQDQMTVFSYKQINYAKVTDSGGQAVEKNTDGEWCFSMPALHVRFYASDTVTIVDMVT